MLVRNYMTLEPKALWSYNTLSDAAFLFYKYQIKGAPVIDEQKRVCGIVTFSQLIKAILNNLPLHEPVRSFMCTNVITVRPDSTLEEAWDIPVKRLPVVDENNKLVGIITKSTFLRAFHAQLERSESEIAAIIHSAHSGILVIDSYGRIVTINEGAARLLNVNARDVMGEDIGVITNDFLLKQVVVTGEGRLKRRCVINGQSLSFSTSPIMQGMEVVGAVTVIQDSSELQAITDKYNSLQTESQLLEEVIENTHRGIAVIDKNGYITRVNTYFEEMFGYDREEIIGSSLVDLFPKAHLVTVAETGVPDVYQLFCHEGRTFLLNRLPLFAEGKIKGALGEFISFDGNQLKDLQKKLTILAQQYQQEKIETEGLHTACFTFENIIGQSRKIVQAKNIAAKAAASNSGVLITGESGTGKEVFAHAIHNASERQNKPFVCVNCAAIPPELLEAELFGFEEGAFTGARKGGKKGKFELANQGTVFLDEVGDMPLVMQAKLLRVLQDKKIERIGGNTVISCDVRIIAATNKNLSKMVIAKTFREDLYYRLNVIHLQLPSLRERMEDFSELASILLQAVCAKLKIPAKKLSAQTNAILRSYSWPGNVRELLNCMEKLAVMTGAVEIKPSHLTVLQIPLQQHDNQDNGPLASEAERQTEKEKIVEILRQADGNRTVAARLLGIHRSTLYEKLKKYDLG